MKRAWIVLFVLSLFLLSACGEPAQTIDKGSNETVDKLPYVMKYNDKEISLRSIDVYQDKDSSAHWSPYMVVRFYIGTLTDDERQYITEVNYDRNSPLAPNDLSLKVHYSSSQNDMRGETMPYIIKYFDGDELAFAYCDYTSKARKDMSDLSGVIEVSLTQDEKYDATNHKINKYTCSFNGSSDIKVDIKDVSEMRPSEEKMFIKGMQNMMK
jgi:hypothetical protein